eukprot:SAG11_NODE_1191_length_5572_cov_1.714364_1_plen_173_part_00
MGSDTFNWYSHVITRASLLSAFAGPSFASGPPPQILHQLPQGRPARPRNSLCWRRSTRPHLCHSPRAFKYHQRWRANDGLGCGRRRPRSRPCQSAEISVVRLHLKDWTPPVVLEVRFDGALLGTPTRLDFPAVVCTLDSATSDNTTHHSKYQVGPVTVLSWELSAAGGGELA